MIQIRKSLFETNSSSTHSVVIDSKETKELVADLSEYVDPADHYIHITFGEFGWGYDEYNDSYTKLQYLLTMLMETKNDYYEPGFKSLEDFCNLDEFLLIESIVCENIPECKGLNLYDSNIKCKKYNEGDEPLYYVTTNGYIDHQSCESYSSIYDFLEDYDLSIEEFLFNPQVKLIIDNDNH